jgi:hypothetical protein
MNIDQSNTLQVNLIFHTHRHDQWDHILIRNQLQRYNFHNISKDVVNPITIASWSMNCLVCTHFLLDLGSDPSIGLRDIDSIQNKLYGKRKPNHCINLLRFKSMIPCLVFLHQTLEHHELFTKDIVRSIISFI